MSFAFREPDWSEVVAVYGGAFDPPHLGHREAAEGILRNPGVKSVRVIPTGNPSMKIATTPAEDRLAMARLNFAGLPRVEIDDREVRRADSRPSYTADTLRELKPVVGAPLAFVIGVDQIEKLPDWNSFPELFGLCHWIAIERKDSRDSDQDRAARERMESGLRRLQSLGVLRTTSNPRLFETVSSLAPTALVVVPTDARAISSAEIRKAYAVLGEAGNLHPDVESYLKAKGLYGT